MAEIEKVIEDLESIKRTLYNLTGSHKNERKVDKAIRTIRELQNQIPKWHLCSEELPTDYENVLVDYEYFRYGDYNCMFRTVGIAYYSHEHDMWHVEGGGQQIKIHAWMELPSLEGV